jgi:LacI family transcriptional regulator, galactose operon repressor
VQHLVDGILKSRPRPTALFTSSDSVAAVVYGALAVRGVRVGEEISVISGNNDQALIAGLHPSLTTFDIHAHDIGRLVVRQMESRLRVKDPLPDVNLLIEPHLIAGKSVRTLKQEDER